MSSNMFGGFLNSFVDLEVNLIYYERCHTLANQIPMEENENINLNEVEN
jgi:hypothetical protein